MPAAHQAPCFFHRLASTTGRNGQTDLKRRADFSGCKRFLVPTFA
jgi:hypothetical protein